MRTSYSEIIERMKSAGKLKNDSRVAKALGVTPQAFSNYKKRGKLPADLLHRFAEIFGVRIDRLLYGEGPVFRVGYGGEGDFNVVRVARGEILAYRDLLQYLAITPEELVYVGKLLTILRRSNNNINSSVVKNFIDSNLKAITS